MSSTTILLMAAELLGGLAFFLYGMSMMSGGLESISGGKLENDLRKVARNPFASFFLGAGITIAIQSSSAMTVMLVGLVNSGILAFGDTFGIIMGSNVGTTLTSWLLSLTGVQGENFFLTLLKPMTFSPLLAFAGILMHMLSNKERQKNIGVILIGFAVLMTGMDFMSDSMSSIQEMEAFKHLLTAFSSPVAALLISTVFTGIIQSSAATVGIVQAMALTGSISYKMAIPLVLGANIGTCMTALLSSFGTSKNAKRVVALHIYIKVIGSIIFTAALYGLMAFGTEFLNKPASMIGVAVVHTLFNIINTFVLIPFKKPIMRLCEITVKSSNEKTHTVFLDERLFTNSALAVFLHLAHLGSLFRVVFVQQPGCQHKRIARQLCHPNGLLPCLTDRKARREQQTAVQQDSILFLVVVLVRHQTARQLLQHPAERQQHDGCDHIKQRVHKCNGHRRNRLCDKGEMEHHIKCIEDHQAHNCTDHVEAHMHRSNPLGIAADANG